MSDAVFRAGRSVRGCLVRRGLLAVALGLLPAAAQAHVKWFAAYDLLARPRAPGVIWSSEFACLALLALLVLWTASLAETTGFGRSLLTGLDLLTGNFRLGTDKFLRCCLAAFFIALWARGGMVLTPELRTGVAAVEWLQAAIAAAMFWQRSMILAGIGIVCLYAWGVAFYGVFHLLDYPIFLGFAAYCLLKGLRRDQVGMLPETVLRWSIGITLMWASVEKWAYPEWTFPLLDLHPAVGMGFRRGLFMNAAGMVEFAAAFALLWTPLLRRYGAILLGATFVSAIFEFGKIDAIGHLPIIAALAVIVVQPDRPGRYPRPSWLPACFLAALSGFILLYCFGHDLLVRG